MSSSVATAPVNEIGYAQAVNYNWWLYDNETTPELIWPMSVYVFDQMRRTDSQVTSVLRAVTLPVRRTPWRIDPNGARDEVVRFVADDLGLPIVGQNPKPPPRSKDRFSWPEHLRQALLMLPFGHMYFEIVFRVNDAGTEAHLRKLAPRMPRTIQSIDVAADGGLVSITQYWMPATSPRPPQAIPVDRLVAYVHEREGGNWLGTSILRPAYKNWLLKDRLLRVQAQTIERNGMGIPLYTTQEGANADDLAAGLAMATTWRAGEAAGTAIPNGADLKLVGVEGTLPDAEPVIRYHDEQIARAVLAHFLNLGTQTGSWALGTTFADFFTLSLQTLAQQIADTATCHIVEDIVDVNFGPEEPAPRVTFDEIGSRQAATAAAIKTLVDAGVIRPDDVLEESSRQQYGLPPANPDTVRQPPGAAPGTAGDVPATTPAILAAAGEWEPRGAAADAAEDDEPADDETWALIVAFSEFTGLVLAADWNPQEHLRDNHGKFRNMVDRIAGVLTKWAEGGHKGDPLEGQFNREQLRRAAVKVGLNPKRGASFAEIKDLFYERAKSHTGGKVEVTPGKPDVPSGFEEMVKAAKTGRAAELAAPIHAEGMARNRTPGLSEKESATLRRYADPATNNFERVNAALRRGQTPPEVKTLDEIMSRSHLSHDVVAYRSLKDGGAILPKGGTAVVGHSFTEPAFTSTHVGAPQYGFSEGGRAPLHMRILVPKGTPAITANEVDAEEMLLGRGLTYRVVADHGVDVDGIRNLDVEVTPGKPDVPAKKAVGDKERLLSTIDAIAADGSKDPKWGRRQQNVDSPEVVFARIKQQLTDGKITPTEAEGRIAALAVRFGVETNDPIGIAIGKHLQDFRAGGTPGATPDLTGAHGLSTDPAVREVQIENRIREAFAKILAGRGKRPHSQTGYTEWVSLSQLRPELGPADNRPNRREVDAVLRRMNLDRGVGLVPESNQKVLTSTDRLAAIEIGNQDRHLLTIDDPSLQPLPDVAKSTPLSNDPAVRAVQIENKIREAYAASKKPGRDWVSLADIRDHLGESVNRHEVDAALKRLEQQDGVNIVPESNQKALTQAERDAAVVIGDQAKHAITIADPSPRPLPGGAKPSKAVESVGTVKAEGYSAAANTRLRVVADGNGGYIGQRLHRGTNQWLDDPALGTGSTPKDITSRMPKGQWRTVAAEPSATDPLATFRTMTASDARDALDLKTIPELKPMLKSAGLPVSGRKRDLVDRLVNHMHGGG